MLKGMPGSAGGKKGNDAYSSPYLRAAGIGVPVFASGGGSASREGFEFTKTQQLPIIKPGSTATGERVSI